jgi:hypothetical protein
VSGRGLKTRRRAVNGRLQARFCGAVALPFLPDFAATLHYCSLRVSVARLTTSDSVRRSCTTSPVGPRLLQAHSGIGRQSAPEGSNEAGSCRTSHQT